ncbi:MAG: bifunctional DNA primase/polymerase [Tepidisphaeraceae bacterium]
MNIVRKSSPETIDPMADAQRYLERGWSVVPIGANKKSLEKWRPFQNRRPTRDEFNEMFSRRGVTGVAVIAGDVSGGLAIRDFDNVAGYHQWAEGNAALARGLPTVKTPRGFHIYHRSEFHGIKKMIDGEYRGAGYTIAPRSLHPSGERYQWICPLPAGRLPFVGSAVFFPRVESETSETSETSGVPCSDISDVSDVSDVSDISDSCPSPDEIVRRTLPKVAGERNSRIFGLARGLKYNAGLGDAPLLSLMPIVRRWHELALPIIRTKSWDETWADFVHAFDRARHPLGESVVDQAALRIDPDDLPDVANNFDGLPTRRLIGLCWQLSRNPAGRFFISSHDAARRLNIKQPAAWRLLQMLSRVGVLEILERGNERKATRYRWIGGAE